MNKIISFLMAVVLICGFSSNIYSQKTSRPSGGNSSRSSMSRSKTPSFKPSSPSTSRSKTPSFKPNTVTTKPNTVTTFESNLFKSKVNTPSFKPNSETNSNSIKIAKEKEQSKLNFDKSILNKKSEFPSMVTIKKSITSNAATSKSSGTPNMITSKKPEEIYIKHYGTKYDVYSKRPWVDVGSNYSPLFWYAVLDWSTERQAMWFYHNQNKINQDLYREQLVKNEQLRLEIEKLKLQKVVVNENYVDSEFSNDPSIMYNEAKIDVSTSKSNLNNEQVVETGVILKSLKLFLIIGSVATLIYFLFFHNFSKEIF